MIFKPFERRHGVSERGPEEVPQRKLKQEMPKGPIQEVPLASPDIEKAKPAGPEIPEKIDWEERQAKEDIIKILLSLNFPEKETKDLARKVFKFLKEMNLPINEEEIKKAVEIFSTK